MEEIFAYTRAKLAKAHPALTAALNRLHVEDGAMTATDGTTLFVPHAEIRAAFLQDECVPARVLMHAVAHCLLGHLWMPEAADSLCDLHAALFLAEIAPETCPCKGDGLFEEVRAYMRGADLLPEVGTRLHDMSLSEEKRARLRELTKCDSHVLWTREKTSKFGGDGGADWVRLGRAVALGSRIGTQAGNEVRRITLPARERAPYAAVLRRYAAHVEHDREDPDMLSAFWYHCGMTQLGRPLFEPNEEREELAIEDLVIAIDTSGSCVHELTERFLALTRDILLESGLLRGRCNLHILQCDTHIRRDDVITDRESFERYIRDLTVIGGGGTDFRPVFRHVEELVASGQMRDLRGMLFFTDGRGIYPDRAPSFGVTFVFLKDRYDDIEFPVWAEKLVLDL